MSSKEMMIKEETFVSQNNGDVHKLYSATLFRDTGERYDSYCAINM